MLVLLVEDHARTREAIARALERRGGHNVVGVGSLDEVRSMLTEPPLPDVALVDLNLGLESGMDAIEALKRVDVPAVALTIADDADHVRAALAAGARGYLLKDDSPKRILEALEDVVSGRHPISSGVTQHLFPISAKTAEHTESVGLTPRETDVLIALARGLSYAECADVIGCSLGTVQSHVKRVYSKLDVSSKTEACAWAMSAGLVE